MKEKLRFVMILIARLTFRLGARRMNDNFRATIKRIHEQIWYRLSRILLLLNGLHFI